MTFTRIGANNSTLQSVSALVTHFGAIKKKFLTLSSGKHINSIADNPASALLARGLEAYEA